MKVTTVKNSNGERYYVIFEDGTLIKTTLNIVMEYHVKTDMIMDTETYNSFVSASSLARAKLRALRIITSRPMSVREVTDRLVQKGETQENAVACALWLAEKNLIDDEKYAEMIVRHYSAKGYGVAKVKNELFRRGISRELWEAALCELPECDDTIDKLLRSKLKSENPDRAELKKASDFLLRRGFSWGEIKSSINRCVHDGDDY